MTTEIPLEEGFHNRQDVPCAFAAEGLCGKAHTDAERCNECQRYNDLLRSARELYSNVRWLLTPDGMLVGLD